MKEMVCIPTCYSEEPIEVSALNVTMPPRQFDHIGNQQIFISSPLWNAALCRSMLPQHAASVTLGNAKLIANQINALVTTSGA